MKKRIVIGLVLGALLVLGVFFAAANVNDKEQVEEPTVSTCSASSCGLECGGSCGVPRCGCGG